MKYYTVDELSQMFAVHPETIKREVRRKNLHCFKVGTELRFTQEHVDSYTNVINQGKTTREIELERELDDIRKQLAEKDGFINKFKVELLKLN